MELWKDLNSGLHTADEVSRLRGELAETKIRLDENRQLHVMRDAGSTTQEATGTTGRSIKLRRVK